MNDLTIFSYQDKSIRTIMDEKGNPWFAGKDVADTLGYTDTDQAIRNHCKLSKLFKPVETTGLNCGPRGMMFIPEPDVYRLISHSKLPAAEKFEVWLFEEVLPSIRKYGRYEVPNQQAMSQDKREALELQLIGAKFCHEALNMSEQSKLEMMHSIYDLCGLPTNALPVYTKDVKVTAAASDLLKQNNCNLSAVAFNKLLLANGILEERTRTGSRGQIKKFKILTEKGLQFGQNDVSKHNPRETQPHYFVDSFMELFELVANEQDTGAMIIPMHRTLV